MAGLSSFDAERKLRALRHEVSKCKECGLHRNRIQAVFGTGEVHSKVMLIGEAPGKSEDRQGVPFVGASGQVLDKMIALLHLCRSQCYIANIVKCRPPDNRTPTDIETKRCLIYLIRQINYIMPKRIVTLGNSASRTIYDYCGREFKGVTQEHGNTFKTYRFTRMCFVTCTFHPAATLYHREYFNDMKYDFIKLEKRLHVHQFGGANMVCPRHGFTIFIKAEGKWHCKKCYTRKVA